MSGTFQLHCQTWRKRLLQFLGLLFVCDDQGIKVFASSDFKLHTVFIFLDLAGLASLPGSEQEVLDFLNFVRYG